MTRPSRRALALLLAASWATGLARAQQTPQRYLNFIDQHAPVQWYLDREDRGAWPAPGGEVHAAALDCVALGDGGGRPIRCAPMPLATELRASPSRLSECLSLREVRPAASAVATYARTGAPIAQTVLFVRLRTHQTEEVRAPCRRRGIDACMGAPPGPVIGRRVLRLTEHNVVPADATLRADAFDLVRGSAPWLVPLGGSWPAHPEGGAFDEAPIVAHTVPTASAGERFAAWVDLVTARLQRGDLTAARAALDSAAALSPELTATPFVAPDLSHPLTPAEIDAVADGSEPVAVRHARLRALIGATMFREASDVQHALERARALRATITPPATESRVYFTGEDPRVFVPTVLGGLTRLTRQRWNDPCAPAPRVEGVSP